MFPTAHAQISNPNGCGHFETNRRLLTVPNHPFCSGAPRSPKRHLHQLILSTNKVTLELSSAVKYFGRLFDFHVKRQQSDHIFPFVCKADFSLFSADKKPLRYMNFRNERTFSVIVIVSRPKMWFYFLGAIVKQYFE